MHYDVIIIGGGAAGLMCALEAGKRGRSVLVLERNARVGEKIRISGGGRCNFTNTNAGPANFISQNPHFCTSALTRYTPSDFIALVESHGIKFHEKRLGQLFCDGSAEQIITLLLQECGDAGITIHAAVRLKTIERRTNFELVTETSSFSASSLVIATGGLSIPKLGATDFGLQIACQFGIGLIPPRPGLVPLVLGPERLNNFRELSGVSLDAEVGCNGASFRENILWTHRGVSGPAMLQVSSYWNGSDPLVINLLPGIHVLDALRENQQTRKQLATVLEQFLPVRFVKVWLESIGGSRPMNQYTLSELKTIADTLTHWNVLPAGTEGYAKAEVTVGGIDTRGLSSKTMESKRVRGLYFIGEVVDVTGWLGGYNFQWAWSSGWAAGQAV